MKLISNPRYQLFNWHELEFWTLSKYTYFLLEKTRLKKYHSWFDLNIDHSHCLRYVFDSCMLLNDKHLCFCILFLLFVFVCLSHCKLGRCIVSVVSKSMLTDYKRVALCVWFWPVRLKSCAVLSNEIDRVVILHPLPTFLRSIVRRDSVPDSIYEPFTHFTLMISVLSHTHTHTSIKQNWEREKERESRQVPIQIHGTNELSNEANRINHFMQLIVRKLQKKKILEILFL